MDKCLDLSDLAYRKIRELIVRQHYSRQIFIPVFVAETDQEIDKSVNIEILENISRKSPGCFDLPAVF